jgi:capsular polysaccharide transport system ATP-binding protein
MRQHLLAMPHSRRKPPMHFKRIADRSGLIMVSHSDGTLRQFCQAGIWLHEGQAHWFDDIEDALKNYKDSISK